MRRYEVMYSAPRETHVVIFKDDYDKKFYEYSETLDGGHAEEIVDALNMLEASRQ